MLVRPSLTPLKRIPFQFLERVLQSLVLVLHAVLLRCERVIRAEALIVGKREHFHCAEGLFQQRFIGREDRVFHDNSSQRIMKCDAGIHEERAFTSCCWVTQPCSKASASARPMN